MEDMAFIPLADLVVPGKVLGVETFFRKIFLCISFFNYCSFFTYLF